MLALPYPWRGQLQHDPGITLAMTLAVTLAVTLAMTLAMTQTLA